EEVLIDFRELVGEHSGDNIAEAVWDTLVCYGITHKYLDVVYNNDTFVDGIASRCKKAGIPFNAEWARLRCMPHTIHLVALKVCYFINYISL
ncbi:hypothetical protein BDQ17DRAFT_1257141, partial [Cyathus striatus]